MWLLPGPARGWRRLAHVGAWAVGLYVLAGAVIDQDRVQLSPQGAHAASDATAGQGAQAAVVVRVIDGDTIVVRVAGVAATVRLMGIDTPETQHPTRPIEHYARRRRRSRAPRCPG